MDHVRRDGRGGRWVGVYLLIPGHKLDMPASMVASAFRNCSGVFTSNKRGASGLSVGSSWSVCDPPRPSGKLDPERQPANRLAGLLFQVRRVR